MIFFANIKTQAKMAIVKLSLNRASTEPTHSNDTLLFQWRKKTVQMRAPKSTMFVCQAVNFNWLVVSAVYERIQRSTQKCVYWFLALGYIVCFVAIWKVAYMRTALFLLYISLFRFPFSLVEWCSSGTDRDEGCVWAEAKKEGEANVSNGNAQQQDTTAATTIKGKYE